MTDPAAREPRPTQDVDLVIEIASKFEYDLLERKLRSLGLENVAAGPICRFRCGEVILDVMPTSSDVLGFGNEFYAVALEKAQWMELEGRIDVRVITAPHFIATKLVAFESPYREGHGDYILSRDFEDIVTVVDGRPELASDMRQADDRVRTFIANKMRLHLAADLFHEGVTAHLDVDSASQRRVSLVIERMRELSRT